MRVTKVYAALLALVALLAVIFNRFAVEESFRNWFPFVWRPPFSVARAIVVFSGVVIFVLAVLLGLGLMK